MSNEVPQPIYQKGLYDLAALGWVGLGLTAAGLSVYLYPINGEWLAGVLALVVGLLYMALAKITHKLGEVTHA